MTRNRVCRRLAIGGWLAASAAHAQPAGDSTVAAAEQAGAPKAGLDWQVQVEPSFWYAAASGDIRVPGFAASVDMADLNADSPKGTPTAEATLKFGDWRLNLSGFAFSTDRTSTRLGPTARTSLDLASAEVQGGYRLGRWEMSPRDGGGHDFVPELTAVFGARIYDVDATIGPVSGTTGSTDEFFVEPVAGLKLEMEIVNAFTIDVQGTIGWLDVGDESASSWDVIVGGVWRPVDNLGIQVGYRNLAYTLESGDGAGAFEYDGAIAGLYVGLSLRF